LAELIIDRLGKVGCKTALRLAERAVSSAEIPGGGAAQLRAMATILDDLVGDEATAERLCEVL
jgi:hypothetical protein